MFRFWRNARILIYIYLEYFEIVLLERNIDHFGNDLFKRYERANKFLIFNVKKPFTFL